MNLIQNEIFKYCPKCGKDSFTQESEKFFLCSNCNFNFYLNTAAAVVGLILNSSGKILMTIRKFNPASGKLDLPGGFVDANETAEEALKREIKEELNLNIIDLDYFSSTPNIYHFKDVAYTTLDLAFFCKVEDFSILKPDDDVAGYKFLPINEINIEDIGLSSIKCIIARLKEKF